MLVVLGWAAATGASSFSTHTDVYRFGVVGNRGALTQLQLNRPTPILGIKGRVVQVATSNSDGYALTSSGAVWAWGVANYGELGNGSDPAYSTRGVAVEFPTGVRIVALANPMPFDGALAIDSHGHVWGWGLNALGDLCLSGLTELKPLELPLSNVTLATGARTHSLFATGGSVSACGSAQYGALGTGSTTSSATPVPVVGLPTSVRVMALTSSWEGSGALFSNGAYYDWGYNADGQLGNGSTADSAVPIRVPLPGAVRQAFQGGSGPANGQTVAILANGSVWAWGDNDRGQLGDGTRVSSDVPSRVDVPRWGDLREGQLRWVRQLRHRPVRPALGLGRQSERPARDGRDTRNRHKTDRGGHPTRPDLLDSAERGWAAGRYPQVMRAAGRYRDGPDG